MPPAYARYETGSGGTPIVQVMRTIRNPRHLLRKIGRIVLDESLRSFEIQRMGTHIWPKRYPSQGPGESINVAGVLRDLRRGTAIAPDRFKPRPALIDTGDLQASLTEERGAIDIIGRDRVSVSSKLNYAAVHMEGGMTSQPITMTAKKNLATVMRRARGDGTGGIGDKQLLGLGWMFSRDELNTNVAARPYLGITEGAMRRIRKAIKEAYGGNPRS